MKSQTLLAAAAALFASSALAQSNQCSNGCLSSWDGSGCTWNDGWKCLCGNATAVDSINACISSSTDCSSADKDASYQAIAQLCANAGSTVTAAPEATFSATSGGSAWPTSWGTDSRWESWVSAVSTALPGAPSGWSGGFWGPGSAGGNWGPSGSGWTTLTSGPWASATGTAGGAAGWRGGGPFGGNWGAWTSSGAWTDGPWTSWWDSAGCPSSTWSGWTSGPWGSNAPWTTWTACTASTTATSTYTTTTSGSTVTGVTYGIQVAQATAGASGASGASGTASGASASATSTTGTSGASGMASIAFGSVVAVVLALVVVL